MSSRVEIPTKALGKRAANSILVQACSVKVPKNIKLSACSQMNKGGFSQKGKKLIWTPRKSWLTNISRADSAKFISSQSKRWDTPKLGKKTKPPRKTQNK